MRNSESGLSHILVFIIVLFSFIFCYTAINTARNNNREITEEKNSEFVGSTNSLSDKQVENYAQKDLKYLFEHDYSSYYKKLMSFENTNDVGNFEDAINILTQSGACTFKAERIDKSPGVKILDGPVIKIDGTAICGGESFKVAVDYWGQDKDVGDPNASRGWNYNSVKIESQNPKLIEIADKTESREFSLNYKDRHTNSTYALAANTKSEVDSILKQNKIGNNCVIESPANTEINHYINKLLIDVSLSALCDNAKEYKYN